MNIVILAIGGRGDVEPLLVLGTRLAERGYGVKVVTHPDFSELAGNYGLKSEFVRSGIKELFESEFGTGTYSSETNYFRSWYNFFRMFGAVLYSSAEDCYRACEDPDIIIYSPPCLYFAPQIAERLQIPSIPVFFQPFHPTGEFPHYISPVKSNINYWFNLLTHYVADYIMWAPYLPTINKFRKDILGLPAFSYFQNYVAKWRSENELFIYAFSKHVITRPREWQENARITGYFFREIDHNAATDDALIEFIEDGEKPVFIGFSSTVLHEPEKIAKILIDTFDRLEKRVVLVTGWGGLHETKLPDSFFKVRSVDYPWLFPKMSLLIHHGGAGSTGEAFRSGVPSLVIPFAADQYFWGTVVERIGTGPAPLHARRLTSEKLYNTLNRMLDNESYYLKAREISSKLNKEDGVNNAVDLIDELINRKSG